MTYFWWTMVIWTVIAFALVVYDGFMVKRPPLQNIYVLMLKQFLMLPFLLVMWVVAAVAVLFLLVIRGGHLGRGK